MIKSVIVTYIATHFYGIQEHEKSLQSKRREQEQWEKDAFEGLDSIVPHSTSSSVDDPQPPTID